MSPQEAAVAAVAGLATLHNNPDDISAKAAVRAAMEGRPAFWSTARYHDQHARNFLDEANDLPLTQALYLRREARPTYSGSDLLGTLIPLNPEGAFAIADARRGL